MKWIKFKDRQPVKGEFIVCIRTPYPKYYWMGYYNGIPVEEEDEFDYYIVLEKPPEEDKE